MISILSAIIYIIPKEAKIMITMILSGKTANIMNVTVPEANIIKLITA